jgi:hypothetical protein
MKTSDLVKKAVARVTTVGGYVSPSTPQTDQETTETLKTVTGILTKAGYKLTSKKKASATQELKWEKPGTKGDFVLAIWHGTGNWGKYKAILGLYYTDEEGEFERIAKWDFDATPESAKKDAQLHTKICKDVVAYLTKKLK